ncbi:hypothetical protein [Marinobacter sp. tcs-11]|uniref:hypothetical protein n=1 Tax=Marinobacter sp. tcs-11 TaxID=1742860 RepID=UPI00257FE0BE|nr:hypothetical protein [Marinobacter sp. tcs-11]
MRASRNIQSHDSRTHDRGVTRKANQVNVIKMLLAVTLFIGAIMEVDMPQPKAASSIKMNLDCPLVSETRMDNQGAYSVSKQQCFWQASL